MAPKHLSWVSSFVYTIAAVSIFICDRSKCDILSSVVPISNNTDDFYFTSNSTELDNNSTESSVEIVLLEDSALNNATDSIFAQYDNNTIDLLTILSKSSPSASPEPELENPLPSLSLDQLSIIEGNKAENAEVEPIVDPEELQVVEEINVRERAIDSLMKIFGLPDSSSSGGRDMTPGPPPEFMIDLYNTITDSFGVTRAKNPYDAHVVRSFIERDNSLNDFFYFNISGMETTETVLEAELHVHRQQTPYDRLHPSLHITPFYILSLYQVLDPKNLAVPDLHRLLGVHYVPALGSGWEVFNVKRAVLEWMSGERTNHGFLVAATSLGGDRVPVRFSRRGETLHSKQPIVVLFNEDSKMRLYTSTAPNNKVATAKTPKTIQLNNNTAASGQTGDDEETTIPTSSLENPRFHHTLLYQDSIRHPNSVSRFRSRRSKNNTESTVPIKQNFTECGRHDLFVSFEAIGWSSWIISPKGYNAFYCDGPCSFPLGQQVKPTNHATVQSIVHELNLAAGVKRPCCVPTMLLPISLLYYDDHDNVVLKQYVDMVAESCGCH